MNLFPFPEQLEILKAKLTFETDTTKVTLVFLVSHLTKLLREGISS
jgi:hypothetical protein